MLTLALIFTDILNYTFDNHDLICLGCCLLVGLWYLWKKVGLSLQFAMSSTDY